MLRLHDLFFRRQTDLFGEAYHFPLFFLVSSVAFGNYAIRTVWKYAFLILEKKTEAEAETNFKVIFLAHLMTELEVTERCLKKEDPFLSLCGSCLTTLLG